MADTTLTVALGDLAEKVEERVRSGAYESTSDVLRAGLEALEREEREFAVMLKRKVEEAIADPRPWLSADDVSKNMEAYHQKRMAESGENV